MPNPDDLPALEAMAQKVHEETLSGSTSPTTAEQRANAAMERFKDRQNRSQQAREDEFRIQLRTAIDAGQHDMDVPTGIPLDRAWEILKEEVDRVPEGTIGQGPKLKTIGGKTKEEVQSPPVVLTLVPQAKGKAGSRDHVAIPSHLRELKLSEGEIRRATILIEDLRTEKKAFTTNGSERRPGPPTKMSQSLLDLLARKYGRKLPPVRNIQVAGSDEREYLLNPQAVIAQLPNQEPIRLRVLMIESATNLLDHKPLTLAIKPTGPKDMPWPLPNETLVLVAYENAGVRVLDHHVITGTDPRSTSNLTWYTTVPVIADANDPDTDGVDLSGDLESN